MLIVSSTGCGSKSSMTAPEVCQYVQQSLEESTFYYLSPLVRYKLTKKVLSAEPSSAQDDEYGFVWQVQVKEVLTPERNLDGNWILFSSMESKTFETSYFFYERTGQILTINKPLHHLLTGD